MRRFYKTLVAASIVLGMNMTAALAATGCQSIAIPAYFWRTDNAWNSILGNAAARARVSVIVIPPCSDTGGEITPCVKPGDKPIAEYTDIIRRAKTAGIKVLSYVWTDYGRRTYASIAAEISRTKANYNVDGIFLDGVSTASNHFTLYANLSNYIRSARGGFVAMNPGVVPSSAMLMAYADLLVTFEGTYSTYVNSYTTQAWTTAYPASRFWHLVHATPATATSNAVRLSELRNAGAIYVTDDILPNPWDRLPSYFSTEMTILRSRCG